MRIGTLAAAGASSLLVSSYLPSTQLSAQIEHGV